MPIRKIVFSLIISIGAVVWATAQGHADPVLIKLSLEKPGHWSEAREVGVIAYHRFDNSVLAEFEKAELGELDQLGLVYQIIDEEPWTEEYFLAFPAHGVAEVNLEFYGRILLKDRKWQLIKTSRERAFELLERGYKVVAIRHRPIPLEYRPPVEIARPALKYSPGIDSLLNLVSEDSLSTWVLRLQNFQTRYCYSDSRIEAKDWLYQKFDSFDIDSLWLHYFYLDSDQWNVVATVPGTARPDRVLVVGGHYDSIVYGQGTDPFTWAPGADDNASGTAATLETARIIAQNPLPVTTMFVPFAQEEVYPWLVGSDFFAQYLYDNSTNVVLMINCDMIAHSVDVEPDIAISAAPNAMGYVNLMIDMANTYTSLNPLYVGEYGWDEASFDQRGYHAVAAHELDHRWAGYHTDYDVIDSLNFPFMKEVVKMCLATLWLVGQSPSFVEGLEAVDAGDGNTIYLSWSANPPDENIVQYKVYFGTTSGGYDSLHQVSAPCDTLRNLMQDSAYFIGVTAVNSDGFESVASQEVCATPKVVPRPPAGLVAEPSGKRRIKLDWLPNQEADLDHYKLYRSEDSSAYQLLCGVWRDTTYVDSTVQGTVAYYYYALTAVDTGGNESEMSDEVRAAAVTLDQGILVVDETYQNIAYNMVDDDSTNAFYDRALKNYTHAYADHSCPNCYPENQLQVKELTRYEAVIVHSEDHRGNRSLGDDGDSTYSVLKEYLSYGGKVIIEGRRNLSEGNDGDWDIREFSPGDVPYDYLKVKSAYVPPWSPSIRSEEFIGALSQVPGYPDLQVDSLRVAQCCGQLELEGKVPGVGYIDSLIDGQVIYTFHSAYDTSSSEGKPVAFRYLHDDYKVVYFDFPLYFIQEGQATQLLHQALSDLGMSPTGVEVEESKDIASFSLEQNFPNPFNPETVIRYSLLRASEVRVSIYNILGQKVRTLVDGRETAGQKSIIWDGKNERGEEVSSGIYFYRLEAEEFVQTKKMLLLK